MTGFVQPSLIAKDGGIVSAAMLRASANASGPAPGILRRRPLEIGEQAGLLGRTEWGHARDPLG